MLKFKAHKIYPSEVITDAGGNEVTIPASIEWRAWEHFDTESELQEAIEQKPLKANAKRVCREGSCYRIAPPQGGMLYLCDDPVPVMVEDEEGDPKEAQHATRNLAHAHLVDRYGNRMAGAEIMQQVDAVHGVTIQELVDEALK